MNTKAACLLAAVYVAAGLALVGTHFVTSYPAKSKNPRQGPMPTRTWILAGIFVCQPYKGFL